MVILIVRLTIDNFIDIKQKCEVLEVLIVSFTYIRYHFRIFYLADEIKFNKHHNHERKVKHPTSPPTWTTTLLSSWFIQILFF